MSYRGHHTGLVAKTDLMMKKASRLFHTKWSAKSAEIN